MPKVLFERSGRITRHSPEVINFKNGLQNVGWKQSKDERDRGVYDWSEDCPINAQK